MGEEFDPPFGGDGDFSGGIFHFGGMILAKKGYEKAGKRRWAYFEAPAPSPIQAERQRRLKEGSERAIEKTEKERGFKYAYLDSGSNADLNTLTSGRRK